MTKISLYVQFVIKIIKCPILTSRNSTGLSFVWMNFRTEPLQSFIRATSDRGKPIAFVA